MREIRLRDGETITLGDTVVSVDKGLTPAQSEKNPLASLAQLVRGDMPKAAAIELLGGSAASAARAIGIRPKAVEEWPEHLPARLSDRVVAALVRQLLSVSPPEIEGDHG